MDLRRQIGSNNHIHRYFTTRARVMKTVMCNVRYEMTHDNRYQEWAIITGATLLSAYLCLWTLGVGLVGLGNGNVAAFLGKLFGLGCVGGGCLGLLRLNRHRRHAFVVGIPPAMLLWLMIAGTIEKGATVQQLAWLLVPFGIFVVITGSVLASTYLMNKLFRSEQNTAADA